MWLIDDVLNTLLNLYRLEIWGALGSLFGSVP